MRQADSVCPTGVLQDQRTKKAGFRPDIEGLRAIAVLAVVLFHAEVPGLGGGYVGVDVFFVISGFLITGLLWREAHATGTVRLRSFYGARARRLLPASALVGATTLIASVALLPPLRSREVVLDGIASALYVSNYAFMQQGVDYFGAGLSQSPFLHYWSLGVEEQFYLVWAPMLLGAAWLVRRVRRRTRIEATSSRRPYLVVLALVAIVSFALSLAITYVMPLAAFFSLPTRAWQLALGGLVALTAGQWHRLSTTAAAIVGTTGLAAILLSCVILSPATLYPGTAALLPTLGAVLVIGAGCATTAAGCGRMLGVRPLRAIGRISYSWYLWHWPFLVLAPPLLGHPLGLSERLMVTLLSAALAALTLRFVENPLRFAPTIRNSAGNSLGLGAGVTAITVCVGVVLLAWIPAPVGRGAPAAPLSLTATPVPAGASIGVYNAAVQQAFGEVQAAVAASADLTAVPSNLQPPLTGMAAEHQNMLLNGCLLDPFQSVQPECATGDIGSATTVALVGDSFAAMWHPALENAATQQHWRLETLTRSVCPMLNLRITNPFLHREDTGCAKWRGQTLDRLRDEHPRLVVLSMSRSYSDATYGVTPYGPAWIDSLSHMVRELRSTGAEVLVLGPIPDPRTHVPVCLSGHLDNAAACSPTRSSAVDEFGIGAEAAATEASGGHYVDVTDLFCTSDRCPVIVGNTLVYADEGHVSPQFSRLLAPVIGLLATRTLAQS